MSTPDTLPNLTPTRSIAQLVGQFVGTSAVIPVSLPILRLVDGDYEAAVFLAQSFYWSSSKADGWFYKTGQEWRDELMLSPHQVRKAVVKCQRWVKVEKRGLPAKNHYRVDTEQLVLDLHAQEVAGVNDQSSTSLTTGDEQHSPLDVRKRSRLYTEITYRDYLQRDKEKDMSSGEDAPSPDLFEAEMEPLETAVATAPLSSLDNVPGRPEHSGPNAGEKVPGGAAAARREMQDARKLELQHIWNAECGPYLARLRYPDKIIKEHRKPLQDFMADVKGEHWADVVRDWTYACRSVAAEPWWVDAEKRYGFKTLLAKWRSKAQQWEAQPLGIDADPEDVLRYRRAQEAEGRGQGRGEAKLEVSGPEGDWRGRKW